MPLPKIAVASDIHFGNRTKFSSQLTKPEFPGCNSRFHHIAEAFRWCVNEAVAQDCEALFLAGDIFHERGQLPVSVLVAVKRLLEEAAAKIRIVMLYGNHDVVDLANRFEDYNLHSLYLFDQTVSVVNKPSVYETDSFFVATVPYDPSADKTIQAARSLLKGKPANKTSILLLHHSVDGAVTGPWEFVMPHRLKAEDLPYADAIFSGHYHLRQTLGPLSYVGCLLQHDLGERNYTPGFVQVQEGSWHYVDNKSSPVFSYYEGDDYEALKALPKDGHVQITWHGEEDIKEQVPFAVVEHVPKVAEAVLRTSIQIQDPKKEMASKYLNMMYNDNPPKGYLEFGLGFME